MAAIATVTGSAGRWGPLWGARARDWAAVEEQQTPTYEAVLARVDVGGKRLLEVGCGSGVFLRLAADRGARVTGIDASEALLELARARVPEAELAALDMQYLPYPDDTFDCVAGFNAFFFAADIVAALREAGRVAKPGAPVVIQVWGSPDRCDLTAMKRAVASVLPSAGPPPPPAPALWEPGALEALAGSAGLTPGEAFDLSWAFAFPGEEELARAMLAPGLVADVIALAGEDAVRRAIVDALAPFRTPDGRYELVNEWHTLIAAA